MSPSESRLRPARAEDEAFLDALYATTRDRDLGALPLPDETKRDLLLFQAHAQRVDYRRRYPDAEVLVIELEGRPAGRLWVDRSADGIRLVDLSLLPEHRGRGIGGRLVGTLIEEARSRQLPLWLSVELSNPARRLYERLGFESRGDDGIYASMVWTAPAATKS